MWFSLNRNSFDEKKMARSYLLCIAEEERLKTQMRVSRRILRLDSRPLEMPDSFFRANFRLTKAQFVRLCNEICPVLKSWRRNTAVQPELKVTEPYTEHGPTCSCPVLII